MIFLFKVTHWDSIKNPYFSMVPGIFLQKKLTKKSLRIIPWDFPRLPPSAQLTTLPLCFAALIGNKKVAKDCKKKEEESKR